LDLGDDRSDHLLIPAHCFAESDNVSIRECCGYVTFQHLGGGFTWFPDVGAVVGAKINEIDLKSISELKVNSKKKGKGAYISTV
jgi:hypothetical protein